MWAAASVSAITRIAGTTPATAPSKRSCTPARARRRRRSPRRAGRAAACWRSPRAGRRASARSTYSRAGSVPPISSTIRSLRSRRSSKSPAAAGEHARRSRAGSPTSASIASARSLEQLVEGRADRAVAEQPDPERALRRHARQVVEGLAAHDDARVAVLAEDHRRARHRVVVVRHRVAVGAGGRDHEHVARARVVERHVADEHVARLAVHARDRARARRRRSGRRSRPRSARRRASGAGCPTCRRRPRRRCARPGSP